MIEQVLGALGALLIYSVISVAITFFIAYSFFGKPKSSDEHADVISSVDTEVVEDSPNLEEDGLAVGSGSE